MFFKNTAKRIIIIIFFSIIFLHKSFSYDIQITDSISPFFDKDKTIEHYSNLAYYQLDLENWWVDTKQMDESIIRFKEYIKFVKEKWYTHIMFDDLHHLILLENLWIYKDSDIEKRNKIYREYFKKIIKITKENWIWIYITTDMQFYDEYIEIYVWKLDPESKKLKEINKNALTDLFETFPEIDWIIIRIWEWWWAYDNSYYKSKVIYDTPQKVNNFLKEILAIFEKYNKKLIFRTRTIWIWEIWDLIINKETYDKTFKELNSENLIVSIKYTPWDYFWFDNYNPLIWYWNLKQIVEFEIRREYEWWWDFPNYIIDEYKELNQKLKRFDNIIWIWHRNQSWWWWYWRNIIFNFWFNFWNEINFLNIDIKKENKKNDINFWKYNEMLSKEEKTVIKDILQNSRELIKKWFYFDSFRKKELYFWKIRLPSLLWIRWDRPVSSPLILSIIYNNINDEKEEWYNATYTKTQAEEELEKYKKIMNKNSLLSKEIMNSLENRARIFGILALYKESIFSYFRWDWKINKDEILKKINKYEEFIKGKDYLNFDFREVKDFYLKDDLFFEREIFLILWKTYNLSQKINFLKVALILIIIDIVSIIILIKFKKLKKRYLIFSFTSLSIILLISLYIYIINVNHNLIPTYFHEAWSDIGDFIKFD